MEVKITDPQKPKEKVCFLQGSQIGLLVLKRMGGFGEPRHLPWTRLKSLKCLSESRFSMLTSDDVAVCRVECLGNEEPLKCFNSKLPLAPKTGNFVPFLLSSLILGSHIRTRSRQCGLGGNLVSSWTFSWWHFSGSPPPTLGKSAFLLS